MLGGHPWSAEELSARLLRWVVDRVAEHEGEAARRDRPGAPGAVVGAHARAARRRARGSGPGRHVRRRAARGGPRRGGRGRRRATRRRSTTSAAAGSTRPCCAGARPATGSRCWASPRRSPISAVSTSTNSSGSTSGPSLPDDVQPVARVRRACTLAKETLSAEAEVVVRIRRGEFRGAVRLDRATFEGLIAPHVDRTVDALRRTIASAGLEPGELTALLLVGGSARIPLVARTVTEQLGCVPTVHGDSGPGRARRRAGARRGRRGRARAGAGGRRSPRRTSPDARRTTRTRRPSRSRSCTSRCWRSRSRRKPAVERPAVDEPAVDETRRQVGRGGRGPRRRRTDPRLRSAADGRAHDPVPAAPRPRNPRLPHSRPAPLRPRPHRGRPRPRHPGPPAQPAPDARRCGGGDRRRPRPRRAVPARRPARSAARPHRRRRHPTAVPSPWAASGPPGFRLPSPASAPRWTRPAAVHGGPPREGPPGRQPAVGDHHSAHDARIERPPTRVPARAGGVRARRGARRGDPRVPPAPAAPRVTRGGSGKIDPNGGQPLSRFHPLRRWMGGAGRQDAGSARVRNEEGAAVARLGAAVVGMGLAALVVAYLFFGWPVLLVGVPAFVAVALVVGGGAGVRGAAPQARGAPGDPFRPGGAAPGRPDERLLRDAQAAPHRAPGPPSDPGLVDDAACCTSAGDVRRGRGELRHGAAPLSARARRRPGHALRPGARRPGAGDRLRHRAAVRRPRPAWPRSHGGRARAGAGGGRAAQPRALLAVSGRGGSVR